VPLLPCLFRTATVCRWIVADDTALWLLERETASNL
jgi:hypothetical protein